MSTTQFPSDLLACLGCLSTNNKLFCLNDKIKEAYKHLTGMDNVSSCDGVSKYICNYCRSLLLKFMSFRECCRNARNILHNAILRDEIITTEYLNQMNLKLQHKQQQTKTKLLSIYNDSIILDDLSYNINITDDQDHHSIKCDVSSPEPHPSDDLNITYDSSSQKCDIKDCDDHTMTGFTSSLEYNHDDGKMFTHFIKIENLDTDERTLKKNKKYSDTGIVKIEKSNRKNKKSPTKVVKIKKTNKTKHTIEPKGIDTYIKKGKYFETKDNMESFEKEYDVNIITLTAEQQLQNVVDRKLSLNYQHSPYKCELCYRGFMNEDSLKKHVSSQHDPIRGDVVCEFCHFRYKDKRSLTQHLRKHRLRFACTQCKYVTTTIFNAKEHFRSHGGYLYECKHCGKSHKNISSHLTHMRLHHPSELMWCEMCGEGFIGQFGLNAHKKRAHRDLNLPSQCPTCGKRFASPTALTNHTQQSRDGRATCRDSCAHCGECFNDAMAMRDHLVTTHRSAKVYACEKCDKSFSHETQYRAHYRRMHVDSEELATMKKARPWVCEVCGKTCPMKSRLIYHQRNHTGERPYKCTQCPKTFTMKRLLQSHLRVHTSDRPYACKTCPKSFKRMPALKNHELIHSEGQDEISRNRKPT